MHVPSVCVRNVLGQGQTSYFLHICYFLRGRINHMCKCRTCKEEAEICLRPNESYWCAQCARRLFGEGGQVLAQAGEEVLLQLPHPLPRHTDPSAHLR